MTTEEAKKLPDDQLTLLRNLLKAHTFAERYGSGPKFGPSEALKMFDTLTAESRRRKGWDP